MNGIGKYHSGAATRIIERRKNFMKGLVILAFLKTLVITAGSSLIYVLYGFISGNLFTITLEMEESKKVDVINKAVSGHQIA